jgi:uncharacterized protein with HXXEE motif
MNNKSKSISELRIPIWLFPLAYSIHATEEFFGGAGVSVSRGQMRGFNLSPVQFIVFVAVGFLLMMFGIVVSRRLGFPHLLSVILSTIMLVNGSLHVLTAVRTRAYTPGLITSPLIFIPLGAWTLFRLRNDMRLVRYCAGIVLGGGIHLIISLLARSGGSLF